MYVVTNRAVADKYRQKYRSNSSQCGLFYSLWWHAGALFLSCFAVLSVASSRSVYVHNDANTDRTVIKSLQ